MIKRQASQFRTWTENITKNINNKTVPEPKPKPEEDPPPQVEEEVEETF